MKKLILIFLCTILGSHLVAQKTRYNLMFEADQTELTEAQQNEIKKIATWIQPDQTVSIFPLTYDKYHDRLYFPKNAKEQAEKVAAYAESIGFEIESIPANFPTSYKGLSVTVNVTYNIPQPINALSELFPEKPSQYFIIDPTKDTLIIGNEGTKLLFEAGSLLSTNKVKVELKEFYALADLIKGGLPTTSNGKFIETGGSIYLNATDNNNDKKQIKINPNKGVAIDFTIGKTDDKMEIFVKDPRYPNEMNWILPRSRGNTSMKKSWQMTETIYNADMTVQSEQVFHSKEEWEAHLKKRQEEEAQQKKNEEIKAKTRDKMDSKLKTYDLGYINCDRFPDEPLMALAVAPDKNTIAEYYLVFKEVRGVMKGRVQNEQVQFSSVPKNKQATLIAVSYIDKQAYFFNCSFYPGTGQASPVVLQPVEEKFLNEQLALLK